MAHRGYICDETTPIVFSFQTPARTVSANVARLRNLRGFNDYEDRYEPCDCSACRGFDYFEEARSWEVERDSYEQLDSEAEGEPDMRAVVLAWINE